MFVSDALCEGNVHGVNPLDFLWHLNTGHIYHENKHVVYNLYKHQIETCKYKS